MALLLGAVFFLVPFLEMVVIFNVGPRIGWDTTVTILVLLSAAGAWLMKREGLSTWRRVQGGLRQGRMPTSDVIDGFLLLVAGALLLCPGYVTSTLGLLIILPPVRSVARGFLTDRLRHEVSRRIREVGERLGDGPSRPRWTADGAAGAGPFSNGASANGYAYANGARHDGHSAGNGYANGDGFAAGNGNARGNGHAAGNGHANGDGFAAGNGFANGNGHANGTGFGNGTDFGSGHADGSAHGGPPPGGRAYRRPEEAEPTDFARDGVYREFDVIDVDGEEIVFDQGEIGPADN